jgi:hypothetical protein
MFPPQLEQDAFRASNGEFGWIRTQVPVVVNILRSQGMGILGGERWWVQDASTSWAGVIPQRHGPPEVYVWETRRESREAWSHFVERSASETLAAVARWPTPGDLPPDMPGRVLYNLAWVSEVDFKQLPTTAV